MECTCFTLFAEEIQRLLHRTGEPSQNSSVDTSRFAVFAMKHVFSLFQFFTLRLSMYVLKISFGSSIPGLI